MKRFAFLQAILPFVITIFISNPLFSFYSTEKIDPILEEAHSYLGTRWVMGRTDRRAIDCSALVQNSFASVGINIPRTSRSQFAYDKGIKLGKKDNYQKGDLLFFSSGGHYVGHVGIVNKVENGRIHFIHSSSNNGKVAYDYLEGYYTKTFVGGRRLFESIDMEHFEDAELAFEWIPEFPSKVEKVKEKIEEEFLEGISFRRDPAHREIKVSEPDKRRLNTSTQLLSEKDIEDLTPCEIKIMKNEIFARHGYDFHKNQFIERFFKSQRWYRKIRRKTRDERFVKSHFSEIEQANVLFLKQHEGECY